MSTLTTYYQAQSDNLDYGCDFTAFLGSDTISTSTWTVQSGLTVGAGGHSSSNTTTTTTVWLSGGVIGQTYLVSNVIVTAGGRTKTRSFYVKIDRE